MASTKTEIAELLKAPPPSPPVESIISEGFNEELGNADNTTLLPLDVGTLEVICRLNLPGVPLERLSISETFIEYPLAFKQLVKFSCGADHCQFVVKVTQCTSHVDAIKAMKIALRYLTYDHSKRGWEAVKDKKLGNYAVKSKDETAVIWTRWTTVVQVHSHAFNGLDDKPSVDIHALAAVIDSAMKAHKGTISDVRKAGLAGSFPVPNFDNIYQTETMEVKFDNGIHPFREYRVDQDEKACVVEDDIAGRYGNGEIARGRFDSSLKITFHKKDVRVYLAFLTAHKSSLWPIRDEITLDAWINHV